MSAYLTYRLRGPDQSVFLPGPTTHGHYQIEMDCRACHTPMMGVREQACYDCHGADLKEANDTHPKSKFTDPRNADRLTHLDARNCVTCHIAHCHQEIAQDRPSHAGLGFETCATAGCHNYHDNTALYEKFLLSHLHEPDVKDAAMVPLRNRVRQADTAKESGHDAPPSNQPPPALAAADMPQDRGVDALLVAEWAASAHARLGVNCTACHQGSATGSSSRAEDWTDASHTACVPCHERETAGFLSGMHGIRLDRDLAPMTPAQARLPMKADAAHRQLSCVSCHDSHAFDTRAAAVESCLSCHDDPHSRAYLDSPHHDLWRAEIAGLAPAGSGVSCATCHLPRLLESRGGREWVRVEHNQNFNLQPNEKMLRTVCLNCHGLGFALDALADVSLIENNFNGHPSRHIPSLDMVEQRQLEIEQRKSSPSTPTPP
jgi:hypothetical protein